MPNPTGIESLRTFAEQHGELQFAHLCTAALAGEKWAVERVEDLLSRVADTDGSITGPGFDQFRLYLIHTTDKSRPDGAIARAIAL